MHQYLDVSVDVRDKYSFTMFVSVHLTLESIDNDMFIVVTN